MKINSIAFVGVPVTDIQRARKFYEGVLGLKKSRGFGEPGAEEMWLEYDIGPGCLALISDGGKDWPPSPYGTAAAFEVDDFQGYIEKLRKAGVKFVFEPMESPVCWMATVADPDGNRVVIHKRKA